jgi:hypothetical protein
VSIQVDTNHPNWKLSVALHEAGFTTVGMQEDDTIAMGARKGETTILSTWDRASRFAITVDRGGRQVLRLFHVDEDVAIAVLLAYQAAVEREKD